MRVAVLSCGAIVVDKWLFGAPKDVHTKLKEFDLKPEVVFTTSLRAPGVPYLGPILSFKEMPLNMNGMKATPIPRKHGTDYSIENSDGKIFFSERGDVSVADTEGYHLAIIKNKHVADKLGQHVITWPWPDTEFLIREGVVTAETVTKEWSNLADIPANLKSMGVSLEQANQIARIAKATAEDGEENWAIAISQFKKGHKKEGDHWVKKVTVATKEKVSKEECNYREGEGDKKCGNCAFYSGNGTGTCSLVEGEIHADDLCDYFKLKTATKEDSLMEKIVAAGGVEDEILAIYRSKNSPDSYYVNYGDWATDQTIKAVKQILGENVDSEAEAPPPNKDQWIILTGKEWVEGIGPVQRFGDIFVSDLHTAYNNCCDHFFKLGYMNEEERIELAGAIGAALKTLREEAPEDVMNRPVGETVPIAIKELVPEIIIPDKIDRRWSTVYKDAQGQERWVSISSVAVQDRQKETFSTKAMDWALGFAKIVSFKGPLRYRHVPGLDGGDCDFQKRIGDFLFEAGTFRDNKIGKKLKELMGKKGNGVSLGLLFSKDDIIEGVYQRALIFERSVTPSPAVPMTSIIAKGKEIEMNKPTEDQLAQLAQELDMDQAEIKTMYERAVAAGGPLGLKEFETALKETLEEDTTEEAPTETKLSKKEMLAILKGLTVAEFKDLEKMIAQVKADEDKEDDEEEAEEGEESEEYTPMPMAKKKKEHSDPILAALKQQGAVLKQQGEALTAIMAAMTQQSGNDNVETAVQKILSKVPRGQAQFVSNKSNGGQQGEQPAIDSVVAAKLKELEDKIAANSNNVADIREIFTSKNLNQ